MFTYRSLINGEKLQQPLISSVKCRWHVRLIVLDASQLFQNIPVTVTQQAKAEHL